MLSFPSRQASLLIAVCGLSLVAAPLRADEPLRWKFTAGEDLVLRVEQTFDMEMQIPNQDKPVASSGKTTMEMSVHVESVDDSGTARLKMGVKRMQMGIKGPGIDTTFDSDHADKDADSPLSQTMGSVFEAMKKLDYSFSMSPEGKMSDIKVPEGALDAFKGLPGMEQYAGLLNEETFKESFTKISGSGWLAFPDKALALGDTWKQEGVIQDALVGKQTMLSEYKFEGPVEQDGRTLEAIGVVLTMDFEAPADGKAPVKIDITEQEQKGTIYFDRAAGRLDHGEMKMKMTMDLETMGQHITQTIVSTTKSTLAPAERAASPGEEAEKPKEPGQAKKAEPKSP